MKKMKMFFQCLADPNAPPTTTQSPPSGNNFTIFHGVCLISFLCSMQKKYLFKFI